MYYWKIIFICSCFIIFYNYAGYAILIYIINIVKKGKRIDEIKENDFFPSVSFIVAAFNEEDCIEQKVKNSLDQDYPHDKIEYIFVTDGSSDGTAATIQRFPGIRLLHRDERGGKSAAINRAVADSCNKILIFSDANTILNKDAVRNISRHYSDEKIGGVAGEKKVLRSSVTTDAVGASEGFYWKYESLLKKIDSEFYSVVGAAGELFSLRRELYEPISPDVILDDFVLSLKAAEKGFRIIYEPDAYAMELPSFSMSDEKKRKVRISAGGFQSIAMLNTLIFKFWKHPRLSFLYISHRVLRWTLTPVSLILAFISNLILAREGQVFTILFAFQVLFYLAAFFPTIFSIGNRIKILKLPSYFVFMNISVIQGFFRFIQGKQSGAWEKARRLQSQIIQK